MDDWLNYLFTLLPVAATAGFLAGLLGIGGGILTTPILVYALRGEFGPISYLQQIAIATSFAIMVVTVAFALYQHHRSGKVRWDILRTAFPFLLIGASMGSITAAYVSSNILQLLFIIFLFVLAFKNIWSFFVKVENITELTAGRTRFLSFITGLIASLAGIGSGVIFVPFLLHHKIPIKIAAATSPAVNLSIALIGAIINFGTGILHTADLPHGYFLGFIYLPWFFALAICSIIFVPLGAKVSAKASPALLKGLLTLLLFVIACRMLYDLWPIL